MRQVLTSVKKHKKNKVKFISVVEKRSNFLISTGYLEQHEFHTDRIYNIISFKEKYSSMLTRDIVNVAIYKQKCTKTLMPNKLCKENPQPQKSKENKKK